MNDKLKYSALVKDDLIRVATRITTLNEPDSRSFVAFVYAEGHMVIVPADEGSKQLIGILNQLMTSDPNATPMQIWGYVAMMLPINVINQMRDETARWLVFGKDETSEFSAGGFNQHELNDIVDMLDVISEAPQPPKIVFPDEE